MNSLKKRTLNTPVFILAGLLIFTSCDKKEREQLKAEAELLEQKLQERDSAYNAIMNIMVDVESQIEAIKEQENLITNASGDVEPRSKEQMVSDIRRINELISSTNEKVQSLSSNLENSQYQLNAFKKRVQQITADLEERETAMAQLRQDVESKEQHIAELSTEVESLVTRVQSQTDSLGVQSEMLTARQRDLNTAYFAVDDERKLREEGLISKEGGFLGIGSTLQLSPDVPREKFSEVDIQETKRFYIDSKKMEIVTEHPSDSYKVVKGEDNEKIEYLEITDPSRFWGISKYLVVSIKS